MAATITERGQRLGHAGTITGPGMTNWGFNWAGPVTGTLTAFDPA